MISVTLPTFNTSSVHMPTQPPNRTGTVNMSTTGQSAVMLCGCSSWGVKPGTAHSIRGCRYEWQVKLRDPSLTPVIPERFEEQYRTQYTCRAITSPQKCMGANYSDEYVCLSVCLFVCLSARISQKP